MTENKPLVSAVVLNFGSPQVTVSCVHSLMQQSIIDEMEILVIDNGSHDESIGVLRNRLQKYKNIRIIETPKNTGFGAGYNYGIQHARGELLLINNPAKTLPPDGVQKLAAKIQSDESIGILAPELVHPDGSRRLSARTYPSFFDVIIKRTILQHIFPKKIAKYLQTDKDPSLERNVDWVAGGCFMITRSFFIELGGFDDRFFLFFEDIDLCRRCHQKGKKVIYDPSVSGSDKKKRLSEGGTWTTLTTRVGHHHLLSALKYFWKWRNA